MTQSTTDDRVEAAREAADRHAWTDAHRILSELDHEGRLDAAGLELLGTIAWWAGEPDVSVTARERSYSVYLKEGNPIRAAMMALVAGGGSHVLLVS